MELLTAFLRRCYGGAAHSSDPVTKCQNPSASTSTATPILSDGELTPDQLAERLAAAGVRTAALTDHDTIEGLPAFREALTRKGVGFVTGVELTVVDLEEGEKHILGYGFDPANKALGDLLGWAAGLRRPSPLQALSSDMGLPFLRRDPGYVNLVKLYGDLNQPETIVLTREQDESFFLQRPQMIKLLETELARSDLLYLGWSHTDPYFHLVFGEMLSRFQQFIHTGSAVMFDVPENQRLDLERKHIRVVELSSVGDRTAQLANWLDQFR